MGYIMFDFLATKFSSLFSSITGQQYLSEKNLGKTMQMIQNTLIDADVPYDVVQQFIEEIKAEVLGKKVLASLKPGEQFASIVHKKLVAFLGGQHEDDFSVQIPSIILVMGLQGSGKTTTIAKLAKYVQDEASKEGKKISVLLASVDFYRPAAINQLEVLAQRINTSFYRASENDPVAAANEIAQYAHAYHYQITFLDTAGRLHVDNCMLDELRRIDTAINPKHKLLILDAMTGQESLRVAQAFDQSVGFHGAILTKMDSETRAGAAFSFRYALKKSILFLADGEKVEDLQVFRAERIAGRILGMGDVKTLVEHAEKKIKQSEQEEAQKALMSGNFTLQDFAKQMDLLGRLGSIANLMKYIPGVQAQKVSEEQLAQAEREMKRFKAIINGMTRKERLDHTILNGSRKARIAKGSGVAVSEVNSLLKRFEEMQQYGKLFKRMSKSHGFFNNFR
jgi:signal recognition particle subunit SRP54